MVMVVMKNDVTHIDLQDTMSLVVMEEVLGRQFPDTKFQFSGVDVSKIFWSTPPDTEDNSGNEETAEKEQQQHQR